MLFVDHFLRIIKAAPALHLATDARISRFGRPASRARSSAHLLLGNSVADANDHALQYNDNENYSQPKLGKGARLPQMSSCYPRRKRRAISAVGQPTNTMCANNWVVIERVDGGQAAGKRSGTTIRFITT